MKTIGVPLDFSFKPPKVCGDVKKFSYNITIVLKFVVQ